MPLRHSGRAADELRTVAITPGFNPHAEGSAFIKMGATHVLCTASVEDNVPRWMKGKGRGWVTAEYGMLPRSTHSRMNREAARGKQGGRTVEIQRLIGRSLRAVTDLEKLGERQVIIDCDVLQADGGTRTAAITGGWVALSLAMSKLVTDGALESSPIFAAMAAVSCGIVENKCVLDLDYPEDSSAQADANFVLTNQGGIIEVQATAEDTPFSASQMAELTALAEKGVMELCQAQALAIE